jgi:hypothetical protein
MNEWTLYSSSWNPGRTDHFDCVSPTKMYK